MKRPLAVVFALSLAVAGGWLAGRSSGRADKGEPRTGGASVPVRHARDAMPAEPQATPDAKQESRAAPARGAALAAQPVPDLDAPLPPVDAPLGPHLDELRRRASAGDARAACRLAMQLDACARLPMFERFSDAVVAARATNPEANAPNDSNARWDAQVAGLRKTCVGVVPLDGTEAFRWQMQAARAGQREMLFRAGSRPSLRSGEILEHVTEWREWRDSALRFLQQAVEAGDARAVMLIPESFGADSDGGRPRIARADPYQQYVYARLRTRVAEASGNRENLSMSVAMEGGRDLDAAARTAAEAEADRMFAAHFAGRPAAELAVGDWGFDDFGACER